MPNTRMKDKGAVIPSPVSGYDSICYQIDIPDNLQYIAAFKSVIAELGKWVHWKKTGGTEATEAAAVWRDAIATLRECEGVMFELRTKPTDECVIQQSTDGGENWTDVFDFGACLNANAFAIQQSPINSCLLEASYDGGLNWTPAFDYSLCEQEPGTPGTTIYNLVYQYITEITIIYNDNQVTYDNDILNIWIDGVYDSSPDDEKRDAAQCLAYQSLVNAIAEWVIKVKEEESNNFSNTLTNISSWLGAGAGIAGSLAALSISFVSPFLALGLALAALGAKIAALLQDTDVSVFEDETARENVACCMYNSLKGSAPTFIEFQASLSSCGFSEASNSENLRLAIEALLASEDLYIQLFQNIQLYTELALLGLELPCPCTPVIGCAFIDYDWSEIGTTPVNWSGSRYVSHGGAYIGDWSRADNADWIWVNEWDEGRVEYMIPGGCTPTEIGLGYERLSNNSYYFNIETWDGLAWTTRANQSGSPGGSWAGSKYFTWSNPDVITVYGVRFRVWTSKYKIYRSRIVSL